MGKRRDARRARARARQGGVFFQQGDKIEVRLWNREARDWEIGWTKGVVIRVSSGSKITYRAGGQLFEDVGYMIPSAFIRHAPVVDQLGDLVRE